MDASSLLIFCKAVLIGLSIAAPVGPIGLLCIQRTLNQGQTAGLMTGLGAAAADAVYGAIGAFGVSGLMAWLSGLRMELSLAGGLFLLWLGWRTWQSSVPLHADGLAKTQPSWQYFASTFMLTLSNPATILSFIAIFAALSPQGTVSSPWWMVLGVLCGSALWWFGLSAAISTMRHRMGLRSLRLINRFSAVFLAGFGLWQMVLVWQG